MPPAVALDQIGHHAVAVLAEDQGLDLRRRQAGLQGDQRAEAGGVELRAQADHLGRIELQIVDRQPGEDVDRVGDDEDDRVLLQAGGLERVEDLLEERDVAVDQIEPALVGLAAQAGGDARSGRCRRTSRSRRRRSSGRRRRWCRGADRALRPRPSARWRRGDGSR